MEDIEAKLAFIRFIQQYGYCFDDLMTCQDFTKVFRDMWNKRLISGFAINHPLPFTTYIVVSDSNNLTFELAFWHDKLIAQG